MDRHAQRDLQLRRGCLSFRLVTALFVRRIPLIEEPEIYKDAAYSPKQVSGRTNYEDHARPLCSPGSMRVAPLIQMGSSPSFQTNLRTV